MKNLINEDLLEVKQRLSRKIKVVTTGEDEEFRISFSNDKEEC